MTDYENIEAEQFEDYQDRLDAVSPTDEIDTSPYDKVYVPFGKHRDRSILEVAQSDPGYLSWMRKAHREDFFDALFIVDWLDNNVDHFDGAVRVANQIKVAEAPVINLTDHQNDITDQILQFIGSGLPIVRLEGGAGYGKSYATRKIAAELIKNHYMVHAMAVSYVATEVLRTQLDDIGVNCGTLARQLGFTKKWDEDQEVYTHSGKTPAYARAMLKRGNALIVDECSMLKDEDAQLLYDTINDLAQQELRGEPLHGRLILVGDSAQLPPVKQSTPSIACGTWETGVATLTEPMRYGKGSDLYTIEQYARTNPEAVISGEALPKGASNEVAVVPSPTALIDDYVDRYKADSGALHRMLLFRRVDVNNANNAIREALFGANAPVIVEDERLMILETTDTPYFPPKEKADLMAGRKFLWDRYYSGQSFRVLSVEESTYVITIDGVDFEIPHYLVDLDNPLKKVRVVFAIGDQEIDSEKLGGPEMKSAMAAAQAFARKKDDQGNKLGNWEPFRQLLGDFVRVSYQYATTVHRAQGQTCDYCYCAPRTLLAVRGIMGSGLFYVAMTRARKHLTVLL